MNVSFKKRVLVGVAAMATLGLVLAPATAASAAPLDNGSQFPIYLVDADTETSIAGQTLQWGSVVSAVANLESPYDRFPASLDATGVKYFISAPGQELTQAQWYGTRTGSLDTADKTNGLSYMPLDTFGDGDRPGDVSEVQINGGTFSLGFVYTNENGNQIASGKGAWFTITVAPGGSWTFVEPKPVQGDEAPQITTQPSDTTVSAGADATFTAAASGSPAPTVAWQSSSNGTTWTAVAGATSTTLTVSATTVAQSGTQYRAVFTNSAGTVESNAATLTVNRTAPTEPTGTDAGNVVIEAPAEGETTITVPAGIANANKTLTAWAWSTPTNLGQVTTDASGDAEVDISGLAAGTHTIALAESDFTVVAWGTIEIASQVGDPISSDVDLSATVTASDLWALQGVPAAIDFGAVKRNATATQSLGAVKVVDDREELTGWSLDATWEDFVSGTDEIPASALTIAAKPAAGTTLLDGITIGTGTNLAQSTAVSTLEEGALFDADLTFKAPKDAKVGEYHSTLTITLTSK
jgi:hypothetical protein